MVVNVVKNFPSNVCNAKLTVLFAKTRLIQRTTSPSYIFKNHLFSTLIKIPSAQHVDLIVLALLQGHEFAMSAC
jgi:hypothetical protein